MDWKKPLLVSVLILLALALSGCVTDDNLPDFQTYKKSNKQALMQDGKPVVYLFSTTWCPHCIWIKDTFDKVAQEYVAEGKIVAYHWEVDTGDNTLTPEVESQVPAGDMSLWQSYNPDGTIPTFVVGGKYYRVGTPYERGNSYNGLTGLEAEEAELRDVLDALIAQGE
jgi:thiol-disulfide isomerase/thioredoxin